MTLASATELQAKTVRESNKDRMVNTSFQFPVIAREQGGPVKWERWFTEQRSGHPSRKCPGPEGHEQSS